MEKEKKKAIVFTFSGNLVDVLDLKEGDLSIEDIAHHTSQDPRYGGACIWHYSVCQHSCLIASYFLNAKNDKKRAKIALLHDAPEALTKDIPSPIKEKIFDRGLEDDLHRVINKQFGLEEDAHKDPLVMKVDKEIIRLYEIETLITRMREKARKEIIESDWYCREFDDIFEIKKMCPEETEALFLSIWRRL